jgi:signal transduction histidine kinase/CheY-like chemotaxis protein
MRHLQRIPNLPAGLQATPPEPDSRERWRPGRPLALQLASRQSDPGFGGLSRAFGMPVEKSPEEVVEELKALQRELAELRSREFERMKTEQELRRELRVATQTTKTTTATLRQTVDLWNSTRRELADAQRSVKRAERAKSEFLINISHELRTPMTAILGFADLLLEDGNLALAPDSRLEHLHTLKRNAKSLMETLSDLFDLSQLEAGEVNVCCEIVSLRDLIEGISSEMLDVAASSGIGLDLAYLGKLPAQIQTDPRRLRQILVNLIGNAIKFTDEGGVRVSIQLVTDALDRPKLRIEVADTGQGMSPEALERIFDPFAQADGSLTRHFGGAGVGLALARGLAELMGGELEAESIEGRGSVFRLTVDPGSLEGAEHLEMSTAEDEVADSLGSGDTPRQLLEQAGELETPAKILYVEDAEDNQRLVGFILQKAGIEVTCADDGSAGVALALASRAAQQPFDLILMDLQMPVMDGYAATRKLRTAGWEGPIIALTAHSVDKEKDLSHEAGCDGFATKPIQRVELLKLVAEHLRKHREETDPPTLPGAESPTRG